MKKKTLYICLTLIISVLFTSCDDEDNIIESTTTQGTVNVAVDDIFLPIIKQEKDAFEHHYTKTKINVLSIKEGASILALLQDSVRLAITSRRLTEQERAAFVVKKINVREYLLAHDAVALIAGKNVTDTLINLTNFKNILIGADQRPVVFEEGNNANLIFIKSKLGIKDFGKNVFSLGSVKEIVDYVAANPKAIGIIGAAWLNDIDDAENKELLKKVQVLGIKERDQVFYPFQEDLYEHKYSLTRDIYVLNSETGLYVGTGFVSFILSDIGQRVVLKSGLLPATSPGREIIIKKKKK